MKNARPDESKAGATSNGAHIVLGTFPTRKDTVTAEVLSRLLAGEKLTALDAVSEASTTRLAAVVHVLRDGYGWPIESTDRAAGCCDGRLAWVSQYELPGELLRGLDVPSVALWREQVRAARSVLREQAPQARRRAARFNEAGRRPPSASFSSMQRGLFEGGAL